MPPYCPLISHRKLFASLAVSVCKADDMKPNRSVNDV